MASSTRAVLDSHYCSGAEQFREHKSVKRVSFLEDDKIVIIPNNEEYESAKAFTTIPRCIPGPSRISSLSPHTTTGLARAGLNGALKSQTQKRFLKAGDTGSLRSKEKQVKSILKKSSTQSCLRKSRFYDSFREEYDIPSIKYNGGVDQQDKSYEKTKLNSSFYFKNNEGSEGSHSYSDFLKRQRSGTTGSPQTSTGPYFSKTNFSPTRTLVQRHGNLSVVSSTSPDEPYRKSEISKSSSSLVRTCKSDAPLGVVGNMLNVSDLYPVLSNLQKNSLSSSDSILSRHQGVGGRYIPARELISRSGSNASRHTRNSSTQNSGSTLRGFSSNSTQSNVSARASSGLGRAAELSLLHRLRKFERNDPPYVAWQASEMNIHSPNTTIPTRASGLTSIYGGSLGSRISTVRSPSSQFYY